MSIEIESQLNSKLAEFNRAKKSSTASLRIGKEIIDFLYAKHLRRSDIMSSVGFSVVQNGAQILGDAVWEVYERVFIACLDNNKIDEAKFCLTALQREFSSSSLRVKRLTAMIQEAQGQPQQALAIYQEIIAKDPANYACLKRVVGLSLSLGDEVTAVKSLSRYLKTFAADEQAWQQLANLYVQMQQFELARFCQDELILLAPENHLYHTQLAQSLYSLKQYDLARAYFSQSLELKSENNLRAAYGIMLCVRASSSSRSSSSSSSSASSDLYKIGLSSVISSYRTLSASAERHLAVLNAAFALSS